MVGVLSVVSSYFVYLEEKMRAEPSREQRDFKISPDYLQALRRKVNDIKLVDSDD